MTQGPDPVRPKKKRLTEAQFQAAVADLEVGAQTLMIARGVLVDGERQSVYAKSLGLTNGAISQAVGRVWAAHEAKNLPEGYERVCAVLPGHQAYIVKKWNEATKKRGSE